MPSALKREKQKAKIAPRKARTVCVKRGENPNLAWKKKKEEKEEKKSKNAKKKYACPIFLWSRADTDDVGAAMEAAFIRHDHGVHWTKNAELDEPRKAVERLLSVEEEVVEATDLQPDSFFEPAFDGE
ncbi:hypothetical protein CKM354_000873400 [Cercospora kikuchii]|uniref:Uncharacterized protein n=1 Tax=Cercospora kikuchii TaxID=84275 RepID=A0A9P3CMK7_9PEZI|nr:uncharacterized protein CKM354_000873400 [Cercospora kikuchii]GIZ45574.1 hypothetical protein CKM354_000873400 [Cercospora kikuchii]